MGRKSTIAKLPPGMRAAVDRMLADGSMTLDGIVDALREEYGAAVDLPSRSALGRYGKQLSERLDAIRASTEAAKIIANNAEDSADARSEALTALIQTELFDAIMALRRAANEDEDLGKRVELVSKAGKDIATLTRSSINLKRFRVEAEERGRKQAEEEARKRLATLISDGEGPDPKEMTTAELEEAIRERLQRARP